MKKLVAISELIRMPNLLIIILTQFLLRYGILQAFLFKDQVARMSGILDFSILVGITVLIAAGGYLINDYFDDGIDSFNKPGQNRVGKEINRKPVIIAYIVVNAIAILAGFYLAYKVRSMNLGLIFPFISILLWFYSSRYKRMLFWGNFVVAILSSLVIFMVWYFEFLHLRLTPADFSKVIPDLKETNLYFFAYGLFAFLVSFFREIIKDLEDLPGDKEYDCRTLPVVLGIRRSKSIVTVLIAFTVVLLAIAQWTFYNRGMMLAFWYFTGIIQLPLLFLVYKLYRAGNREEYHYLSNLCKLIMFAGVLSMQLISASIL